MRGMVLITGADSMLAGYLHRIYGKKAHCLSHQELDINRPAQLRALLMAGKYDIVINTAGVSGIERKRLFDVNAFAAAKAAHVCGELAIPFVYLSSSRVFGDPKKDVPFAETDGPNPLDDYGLSKYTGEKLVEIELYDKPYYIFRLPQVLGLRRDSGKAQGVYRLIQKAAGSVDISVSDDVFSTPAYAGDIAQMIQQNIAAKNPYGLYHLTTQGGASLYELLSFICRQAGFKGKIRPVKHATLDTAGRRAMNTRLSSIKTAPGPDWKTSVEKFVKELLNA